MTATTIFFNGQTIARPGSYSEVDATGLEAPALGASGIIALLATSYGGIPYDQIVDPQNDLTRVRNSGQLLRAIRAGDLREAGQHLFSPSNDPDVPSGAQEVVLIKVNPANPSSATFGNTDGDALTLTSRDYGLFTTQINVTIADATAGAPAKAVTVVFEDSTEVFDDIGTDAKFTVQYSPGSDGAQRATADVSASAFEINFERDDAGLDSVVTTQATGGASLEVLSSDVGDTTQSVTVYGLDASNAPQTQTVTLNGTSTVAIPGTWNLETAAVLDAAAAGTVTIRNVAGAVVVFDIPPATLSEGRTVLDIPVEDGSTPGLAVLADGATTQRVVYRGIGQNNLPIAEVVTLNGTTAVPFVGLWKHIESVELADVEVARTLTLSGRMINAPYASVVNLQQLKDKVNANSDFALVNVIGNPKEFSLSELDIVSGVDVRDPATGSFAAILYDIVEAINASSQLITATKASPATGAPDNTVGATFLTGGHEGDATPGNEGVPTASASDWTNAIDLLKRVQVNTLVPITSDAAVHALCDAHCAFMGGIGRDERDSVVGAAVGETVAQLKARALALNSRHTRLCGQEVIKFNTANERVYQSPAYQAAIVAGMQAGSDVGVPLTFKFANVLGLRQSTTWNPIDDAEEMIRGGVLFMEDVPNRGRRIVRNVTTHLSSNNIAFTEASVNEAVNYAVKNLRTNLEAAVGKKGFSGTINAAKGIAEAILDELLNDGVIVGHRNLTIELILDTLEVEVEIAPVLPVNFVTTVAHLVTIPQAA